MAIAGYIDVVTGKVENQTGTGGAAHVYAEGGAGVGQSFNREDATPVDTGAEKFTWPSGSRPTKLKVILEGCTVGSPKPWQPRSTHSDSSCCQQVLSVPRLLEILEERILLLLMGYQICITCSKRLMLRRNSMWRHPDECYYNQRARVRK